MSFPALRPRVSGYGPTTGAIARIFAGAFGSGSPQKVVPGAQAAAPIYAYHEGDIFRPGSENFVFESLLESPVTAWFGAGSGIRQGTPYPGNAWPVYAAEVPMIAHPIVTRAGLGGLQAGAFVQQPLLDNFTG
jgi:hypothetical protein